MILVCIFDYESLLQTNSTPHNPQLNFTGIKMRVGGGRHKKSVILLVRNNQLSLF